MTIPTGVNGGPAQPVSIQTTGTKQGGIAIPVYGYANVPTDGRGVAGGPAVPVIVLTSADLTQNGGTYDLSGDPLAMPVMTAPSGLATLGQNPVAVYPINSFPDTAPTFVSAEVGNVSSTIVAVTLNQNVSASDYKAGSTIKVNGSSVTISSAARQSNHAIIQFTITPAVVYGDTVTWEYAQASGNIVGETGGVAMADVSAQSVANNVAAFDPSHIAGLQIWLKADAGAGTNDGDAVGTWTDQSGNGNNATQNDATYKPTYKTNIKNGLPVVRFDGVDDFLSIPEFYTPCTIFVAVSQKSGDGGIEQVIVGNIAEVSEFIAFSYGDTKLRANGSDAVCSGYGTGMVLLEGIIPNGGTTYLYRNGVSGINGSSSPGSVFNTIGKGGWRLLSGDIAEIAVYDNLLSDSDRQLVENYLNTRWAIY